MINEPLVLVVIDEPQIARQCRRALEENRFEVATAERAGQAMSVLKNHRVDAVIVGIRMPALDGLEVLKIARAMQPEVPLIPEQMNLPSSW